MVTVIDRDAITTLQRTQPNSVELLIVVLSRTEEDALEPILHLVSRALVEGGTAILAKSLPDAFLML